MFFACSLPLFIPLVSGSSTLRPYQHHHQTDGEEQRGGWFRHPHHQVVQDCRCEMRLGRLPEIPHTSGAGNKVRDRLTLIGRDDPDKPTEALAWWRAVK